MRAMSSIFTIFLLGLLGVFVGLLLARLAKSGKRSAASHEAAPQAPDEATKRRLILLKQQLDSGLITKEEYQVERETLLC